jgi:hypothetical protein
VFNALQVDESNGQSSHPEPVHSLAISDQDQAYPFTIDLLGKETNEGNNGNDCRKEDLVEALNIGLANDLPLLLINDQPLTLDDQSRNNKVRIHTFLKNVVFDTM